MSTTKEEHNTTTAFERLKKEQDAAFYELQNEIRPSGRTGTKVLHLLKTEPKTKEVSFTITAPITHTGSVNPCKDDQFRASLSLNEGLGTSERAFLISETDGYLVYKCSENVIITESNEIHAVIIVHKARISHTLAAWCGFENQPLQEQS